MAKISITYVRALAATKGVVVLSRKCMTAQTKLSFQCPKCTEDYTQTLRNFRRNASGHCQSCNTPSGERNGQFRNFTAEQIADRDPANKLKAFKGWERQVRNRDQVCVLTGRRVNTVAHHLNNWAEFKAQRWNAGNGVLMWKPLHDQFHKRYGHNTTRAQFEEFRAEYLAKKGL